MGSVDEPVDPVYANVMEWVSGYFVKLAGDTVGYRPGEQVHWCPEWWRHTGAVVRLDALWQAWEDLRRGGGFGMSVWLLDHMDPHVRVLLSSSGPFRHCSIERGHRATEPLPVAELPAADRGAFDGPAVRATR
ncbi:DUF4913 domain-containing protein [Nocardia sp. NPDC051833]|uniref:DUF4913 domain-containing protein n=1 Tax=Nocardia sp. NPDC051833 TaxID=3155674 RepID=UPI0034465D22